MLTTLRRRHWTALAPLLLGLACGWPDDMCACPPTRTLLVVRASVIDAQERPVAGAQVGMLGVPAGRPALPASILAGRRLGLTDAAGTVRGEVEAAGEPGVHELRAVVIRPSSADTVALVLGTATFRSERERLDTAHVTLRLP